MLTTSAPSLPLDELQAIKAHQEEEETKAAIKKLDKETIKAQCKALLEKARIQGNKRSLSELPTPQRHTSAPLPRKSLKLNDGDARNIIDTTLLLCANQQQNIASSESNNSSDSCGCQDEVCEEDGNGGQIDSSSSDEDDDENDGCSSQEMECFEEPISEEQSLLSVSTLQGDQYIIEQVEQPCLSQQGLLDSCIADDERILVLDLDSTLVHSYLGALVGESSESIEQDPSIALIPTQISDQKLMVKCRAYLKEFLEVAFEHFQVIMYTLGSITYAKAVHEIFQAKMPDVFAKYSFLRIVAQSASRQSTQQNVEKDISRYFSQNKFSHRLLVLDDNAGVYKDEWQRNIIYTKPFRFWHQNGVEDTLKEFLVQKEDCFLFFTRLLLQNLILADPLKERIVSAYNEQQMTILADEIIFIRQPQPNYESSFIMAQQMGAQIANNEEIETPPTTIIVDSEQESISINTVTDEWLKSCFVYALKIPKSVWHKVKTQPDFEISLVDALS